MLSRLFSNRNSVKIAKLWSNVNISKNFASYHDIVVDITLDKITVFLYKNLQVNMSREISDTFVLP